MKTENKNATFQALQRWRQALSEAICIKNFHISKDGKTFDYDLKDESEYECKDCFAFFCFKSLKWDDDQEQETSSDKPNKINNPIIQPSKSKKELANNSTEIALPINKDWRMYG